jgi:solute:Na+ symporter, SSS family
MAISADPPPRTGSSMKTLDYLLLGVYLLLMLVLGFVAMRRTKTQSDYFLGGRSFGKLLQTFAAFGAGTGAHEPVTVGRAVWFSGLSGVWIAMQWLFVTPIYWITAVWYRRMRHLTLADWFVERYESRALGVAFTLYALAFYMAFLSIMLTAIAKFAVPLLGVETLAGVEVNLVVVPLLALTVILYGVLGGLTAAYWTDLVQGLLIIVLSGLLIPFGLMALVQAKGDPEQNSLTAGFTLLHQEIPADYFSLFSGPSSGEFSLLYIVSFSLLSLVGIVVHPHFIATGGGSAKSEIEARIGLVLGNFLKRLCTVGWALTALIALALLAGNAEIAADPDRAWGVAAREILGPLNLGLVGLMFACLLAAMMSSADTYMLVSSALVVRNIYAAYIQPRATEERYVAVGRATGVVLVVGATVVALLYSNVLEQFRLALEIPILFAAPFWLGLYWRRVNTWAVWMTIAFSLIVFFLLPMWLPTLLPSLRTNPQFLQTTILETTTIVRPTTRADVARYEAWTAANDAIDQLADADQQAKQRATLGAAPPQSNLGAPLEVVSRTGGRAIYWQGGIKPRQDGEADLVTIEQLQDENKKILRQQWQGNLVGQGHFNLDFIIYQWMGLNLATADKATLEALRLPTRLLLPFVVLIALSFVTPQNRPEILDRYYVKMKTLP